MKISSNRADLEKLASSQWGMFTTAQAKRLGIQRNQIARMAKKGRVEQMCYGVYRFTTGDEISFAFIKAAWLSINPQKTVRERLASFPYDAVVAERTATSMLGAGEFYAAPYTFAVNTRRQTTREDIRFLMRKVASQDIVFVDSLPLTSFERTAYDLIRSHEDPSSVDRYMRDASRNANHTFDLTRLSELLSPLAARNGYPKGAGKPFAASLLLKNSADAYASESERALKSIEEILIGLQGDMEDLTADDLRSRFQGIQVMIDGLMGMIQGFAEKDYATELAPPSRQYLMSARPDPLSRII